MSVKFHLQRQGGRRGTAAFLHLPIKILDLALQANLEIIGPAVEFGGFFLEEFAIAFRDGAAWSSRRAEPRKGPGKDAATHPAAYAARLAGFASRAH